MTASQWSSVGRSDELEGAGPFAVHANGVDVVLVRGANGLKAFDGRCPHQGALLGEGELEGTTLVCRNHRWRFDVETGARQGDGEGKPCLVACPVRVAGDKVEVDIGALREKSAAQGARSLEQLPSPPSLPLLGSAHLIDPTKYHLRLESWARELGTPYTYRLGRALTLVVAEVEANTVVLRDRPNTFRRIATLDPIFRELGVDGVFSAEGKAWRVQRRLSMEALAQRHVKTFYPTLATVAERLRERWQGAAERGDVLDLCDELKRFTADVTTNLVFGHDLDTVRQGESVLQEKIELVFLAFTRRLLAVAPWWRFVRMPADHRVDRAVVELHAWIAGLVADARARMQADSALAEKPRNFLEAMLAARDDEGRPFSDETILGNLMTMLGAGEDTTAYTLAWAVHHLADDPSAVKALVADLDVVLAGGAVPETIDTANRLTFAGAVANETMRLRPVAPVILLEACVDTVVADVSVPQGTVVAVLTRPPAVDAANFGDPDVFRPARWIDRAATGGAHNPSAHQPFGSGPRICPGRSLALLEMKVALATLYASFEVERVGASESVSERFAFTMTPVGLRVRLHSRAGLATVARDQAGNVAQARSPIGGTSIRNTDSR